MTQSEHSQDVTAPLASTVLGLTLIPPHMEHGGGTASLVGGLGIFLRLSHKRISP